MLRLPAAVTALTLAAAPTLAPSVAHAAAPDQAGPIGPAENPERTAIVAKGKRLNRMSLGFTFPAIGLTILSIYAGNAENYDAAIGLSVTAVALAGVGVGLAVAGYRRVKHPEKFMHKHAVAVSPIATRRMAGASLRLRF